MQQGDGAVAGLLYEFVVHRVGVLRLPVVCIHRPVEAGHVCRRQHAGVLVAVGRPEHIFKVDADGLIEYAVVL